MDNIPRLETERLKLRAVFPTDAAAVFRLYADPETTRYQETERIETVEQAEQTIRKWTAWFHSDHAVRWGIFRRENDEMIGSCCFDTFHRPFQRVNLAYNICSDHWGQGFATEALAAVIEHAFCAGLVGKVNRIEAITIPENAASEKVLAKLGFQLEGRLREYAYWDGEFRDMNMFSLIGTKDRRNDT